MKRLAYFPVVETPAQLFDILSRAAWFLTFSPISKISIPVADPSIARADWQVAPGMDPAIRDRFPALQQLVEFVPASHERDVARMVNESDIVLRWRQDADSKLLSRHERSKTMAAGRLFEVDADSVRMEGANYIDVSYALGVDRDELAAEHRARFTAIADRLGEFDRAHVLATGPSVGGWAQFDYDDALGIVCNTVLLNDALMERVNPEFAVFLDPIFHFGPSEYAGTFRANLRRAAERFDFTICIASKYYPVFAAAVPELEERTIALPFRANRGFNFDLRSEFEVKTTANVLTFVMIPLATTFAREVKLLGCDGRPLKDDSYFWGHNPTTQLTDKMANIRQVHPGFFKLRYNDYYLEHCETLEEQLQAAERAGHRIETLASSHIPALKRRPAPVPRLLVIDSTRVNGPSATGQLKGNLLRGWPDDYFRQVYDRGGGRFALASSIENRDEDADISPHELIERELALYRPDIVYYRPTIDLNPELHELALQVLDGCAAPLVTHVMDDWPTRLMRRDPAGGREADAELGAVLARSERVLSISERMSVEFGRRYGVALEPVANGVDVDTYRRASERARGTKKDRQGTVLRYSGAIAKDMTFDSVLDVARAVDSLQDEMDVTFEVYTWEPWLLPFAQAAADLRGVEVAPSVSDEEYPALLAEADVLVLAYNFDEDSIAYIGLSMPNKLPECLASGASLLAYGPRAANGIDYVASRELASCVTERDPVRLTGAIRQLGTDAAYRAELGARAQRWAFDEMDVERASRRFQGILREAAAAPDHAPLLGPLSRTEDARVDEGEVVVRLLDPESHPDAVLVDVGAHHGSSSAPFASAGWRVIACEPDAQNRAKLTARFRSSENVTVEPRAVADLPAASIPFYSSQESAGISSLHAFHETHEATQTVEVTTVAELVERYGLDRIDFLKVDVEGLDWKVLQGVPWDQVQPEIIECEFEDSKTAGLGYTYREMADGLVARGYTVYISEWHPIVRYGIPHQWRQLAKYPAPLGSPRAWGNLLAFRKDPGTEAVNDAFSSCVRVGERQRPLAELATAAAGSAAAQPAPRADARAEPPPPVAGAADEPRPLARNYTEARMTPSPLSPRSRRLYARVRDYWLRNRSHPAVVIGRVAAWTARRIREHPLPAAAYLALVGMLTAVGFVPELDPWGKLGWLAASLLLLLATLVIAAGFANFLVAGIRTRTDARYGTGQRRFQRIEDQLRSVHSSREDFRTEMAELQADARGLEARVQDLDAARADLHARTAELQDAQDQAVGSLEQLLGERKTHSEALEARLEHLSAERQTAFDALDAKLEELAGEREAESEALAAKLEELAGHQRATAEALDAKLEELAAQRERLAQREVSLETVAALRQLRTLWDTRAAVTNGTRAVTGGEHGHALLMAQLVEEELNHPGILRGRTLIEIGSTRERDPAQGSSEKLAIFTGLTGMRFVTVDMDPRNTQRARGVLRHLNPQTEVVTARGELFLADCPQPLDYVYLDAFDIDHDNHSLERQERYRQNLDTEINDEACWQMHQSCAASIVTRMPEGGIVVIDDTWVDDAGNYDGKGRLAIPLLLASGFEAVAEASRAVALRRGGGKAVPTPAITVERERRRARGSIEA